MNLCDRPETAKGKLARTRYTVLTVFAAARHRESVHWLCGTLAPGSLVVDVASATDAVLTLLTEPIDLVLIDAGLAGDLLESLKRHAHRSAPHAKLAIFGAAMLTARASSEPHTEYIPWTQLETTLHSLLKPP